jgi:hypothetical protein
VEEFNKLIQDRSVDDYIERFEELRSLMSALNPSLIESYYVSSYISGLKEDIKLMLKIMKPSNVLMAFEQARWQEESNNALTKRTRSMQHSSTIFNNERVTSNASSTFFNPNRIEGEKVHSVSLFKQRKRLRQCFKCGDKYTPGHKCSTKGLHMIEGVEEEEDEGIKELEGTVQNECKEMSPIDEFGLSLNALAENDTYNTIRIKGNYRGRDLIILIDSGSTHNFIDESTISELNGSKSKTTLLAVTVANGNVMLCKMQSPGFTWFMQSYEFKANLRVLKLGRHDIVLGVDWLK